MRSVKILGFLSKFLILMLLMAAELNGQVREEWVAVFNGPVENGINGAKAMAMDFEGNIYVTGRSEVERGRWAYVTIKYNPNGEEVWIAGYLGQGSGSWAEAIALDPEGNVYVTGISNFICDDVCTGGDYATVKYDKEGREVWNAVYHSPEGARDEPRGMAVDSEGNVYVTGVNYGSPSGAATVKYDKNGGRVWVARRRWVAYAIALDSNGNVYVTGLAGLGHFLTIKYDSATGREVWAKTYEGPAGWQDTPYAIAVDSNGNIYVTGESGGRRGAFDMCTIKYAPDGRELWVRYAQYGGQGEARAMTIDPEGNVYITGTTGTREAGPLYTTVKYAPDGRELWAAIYEGLSRCPGTCNDVARAIAVDSEGGVYVTGTGWDDEALSGDYATIKYDREGTEVWVARFRAPRSEGQITQDNARAIAVDSQGNVYVTGDLYNGLGYGTIKYSQE